MASSSNENGKMKPGDYANKMYFLGRNVQNKKFGGLTGKVFYYKKLACPLCDKICRTTFGKAMHIDRFHPEYQSGTEQYGEPLSVELSEEDENNDGEFVDSVKIVEEPTSESNVEITEIVTDSNENEVDLLSDAVGAVTLDENEEISAKEISSNDEPMENQPDVDSSNKNDCIIVD